MHRRIAATLVAMSWLTFTSPARGEPSLGLQPKAPADTQPVNGEWRSGERFDGHARATLVVNGAAGSLTGVLTLLGSRVAHGQRVLLLALAVIDDIGSIVVIALFYNSSASLTGFPLIIGGLATTFVMRSAGVRYPLLYLVPGTLLWAGLLATGIHPTIAGVALGLLTPVRPWFGQA